MGNLQQLRDEILKQEASLHKKEKLLIEREQLAEKLDLHNTSFEETKKLKASLRQLDAELDRLDLITDESLYKIKQDYVAQILAEHPDKRESYEQALNKEARINNELKELGITNIYLATTEFHLNTIINARNRIRKLWILSYLVGNSPNYEITHSWLELKKELDKELPSRLTPELDEQIMSFKKVVHNRWGLGIIDREATPLHKQVKRELSHIEMAISKLKEELALLDKELFRFF